MICASDISGIILKAKLNRLYMEETKYVQNLEQKDFKNGHLQD
jgi:hypothetical protein